MIELKHVTFSYGSDEEIEANTGVKDICFSVSKGQCVVLCGRSGSGKSTILKLISGLAPRFYEGCLSGQVSVNGQSPNELTPEQRARMLGVVSQDPRSQFFMGKVRDEIDFSAENIGLAPEEILNKVKHLAEWMGIDHLLERNVNELSSGQKQRVAIAAAAVLSPPVLLLDEPVSNLDQKGVETLVGVLRKIKSNGTTLVISEHRLHQFLPVVDQYIHIDHGKVLHNWSKEEFVQLSCDNLLEWGLRHPDLVKYKSVPPQCTYSGAGSLKGDWLEFRYKHSIDGVRSVSFELPCASVTALLGENGTGKTTLCKIICGLLKQHSGTVSWENKRLSTTKRRSISYLVMQDADYQLYSDSVGNELVLGKKLTGELRKRAFEALEIFHLTKLKDRHPASLSGGEKQRVTMAAAYCSNADVIVLDEPTSGMDGEGVLGIANWVNTLAETGKIVVIITHDELLNDIACSQTIRLEKGGIQLAREKQSCKATVGVYGNT